MAILTFNGIYNNVNPDNVQLDLSATNDNNGAIYNSADLNVAKTLATDL